MSGFVEIFLSALALGTGFVLSWVLGNIVTMFVMTRKSVIRFGAKYSLKLMKELSQMRLEEDELEILI